MNVVNVDGRSVRRVLAGLVASVLVVGFLACGSSSEHHSSPRDGVGGAPGGGGQVGAGGSQGGAPGGAPSASGRGGQSASGASDGGAAQGGAPMNGSVAGEPGLEAAGAPVGGAGGAGGAAGERGGAGGAGGAAPFVDPVCGPNLVEVGQYSLWCGKVNVHTDANGDWQTDSDCVSGCDVSGLAYCQKFYPTATAVVSVPQLETKDWKNQGCADSTPDGPGISGQAACCAPL